MIVKLNGQEVYRKTNPNPVTYKNVLVSNSFEGYGVIEYEDYTFDYEDYFGEFPLSDVAIRNLHLKSYEF